MHKGPRGERRPADVIGNAVRVARGANGEIEENLPPLSPAAEMGQKGGEARAKAMTPERRAEIARKATARRWAAPRPKQPPTGRA